MSLKLLNCTVRLGGGLTHSVPKFRITELELRLLKDIHGADALADLKHIGEIEISNKDEYRNLARQYSVKAVEKCFDITLDGFSDWLDEQLMLEDERRNEEQDAKNNLDVAPAKVTARVDTEVTELDSTIYGGDGELVLQVDALEEEPVVDEIAMEVVQVGKSKKTVTLE